MKRYIARYSVKFDIQAKVRPIRQYLGLTGSRPEKVANFRLRILNIDLYDYVKKVW